MQRTPEWYKSRLGKITASRFKDAMTSPRSKSAAWSETAISYAYELVGEILTGECAPQVESIAQKWGIEHEPQARSYYEFETGRLVEQVAFMLHPEHAEIGCSPDGLVDDDGQIEIKCPYTFREHVRALESGKVPEEHIPQIQGQLFVTGRQWCDFISYHPQFPESSRAVIIRVDRDAEAIEEIEAKLLAFSGLVQYMLAKITGKEG